MALEKQVLSVSFAGGVDTKTDPKQVIAGKLLTLENGVFIAKNKIKMKNGVEALGQSILSGGSLTVGQGLSAYANELLEFDGSKLYSYNAENSSWINKSKFQSVNVQRSPVVRNTYQQTARDSASHSSGVQVFAWEDSSGGVRYSVIDQATGQQIVTNALIDASGSRPKVAAIGPYVLIFYVVGQTLRYKAISVVTPLSIGNAVTLSGITLVAATLLYDISLAGNGAGQRLFVLANVTSNVNKDISAFYLSTTLVQSAAATWTAAATPTCLTIFNDSHSNVYNTPNIINAWHDGTTLVANIWDWNLSAKSADLTFEVIATISSLTGIALPPPNGVTRHFFFFYTVPNAEPSYYSIRMVEVNGVSTSTPKTLLRSVGLSGKSFNYNGTAYVPVVFVSPTASGLQNTYFLIDSSGAIVAKCEPGIGGGHPTHPQVAEVNQISTTQFQWSTLVKGPLQVQSGSIFSTTGVDQVIFDFNDIQASYLRAELGQALHVSGGMLQMYDGVAAVEHGFHIFPEGVTAALTDADAGTAQSYQYQVCYEWTDNQGMIHRSAPSPVVTITKLTKIDGTHRVTLTIPTLRLTAKQAISPVRIIPYRTQSNLPVFTQTFTASGAGSSVANPLLNDPTNDFVTFIDASTDTTINGNQLLYTTGNVVENIPAPPVSAIVVHQSRIVLLDSTNPLTLWFSKKVIQGAPVEFNDAFTIPVPPLGGPVTAIASLDDKLIIFKENSVFATNGDGLDDTGNGTPYAIPQLVQNDGGCVNPRSIVKVPDGLMYQSPKGIYLLDRSLQVSYIGMDVEAFNTATVTSSQLIPSTNQVRFTIDSGVALVYDYLFKQWSVFTDVSAVDSCIFENLFTYLRSDGASFQETIGEFSDNGASIKMKLTTSWFQFAGIQGFQRVYKFLILGDYISKHMLKVSIAYNFNPNPSQVFIIDAGTLLDPTVYGADSPYGSELLYGGPFPLEQFRIFTAMQKCQAIQISLESIETGVIGEGLSLSALGFEIAAKKGLWKMPATQTFGQ